VRREREERRGEERRGEERRGEGRGNKLVDLVDVSIPVGHCPHLYCHCYLRNFE
jgi:hypothetical protein